LEGLATVDALERAVFGVHGVLQETERRGSYEMALIASAERMRPGRLFPASIVQLGAGPAQKPTANTATG
jgi:pyridoxal/pyridoxine/pyridoxamine kinase